MPYLCNKYHLSNSMHIKDFSFLAIFSTLLFVACSKPSPNISIGCEENEVGNNVIKWEVTPKINGQVKIYASEDPYNFKKQKPIVIANVDDLMATVVNNDPSTRKFYKVVFGKNMEAVITNRNFNIQNVENFRDLGGYQLFSTDEGIKWGMIYRSGSLSSIGKCGIKRLNKLGIKTIINLAPESTDNRELLDAFNYIHIPIKASNFDVYFHSVCNGDYNRIQIKEEMKKVYRDLISDNLKQYNQIFNLLLDQKNYPFVLECTKGKEQTGIVSFLILTSLGVDIQTARLDYLRSNQFIDITEASKYASQLSQDTQEALTALVLAQEDYIDAAIKEIKQSYGSIHGYLTDGIGLSESDLSKLRLMLLEK